MLQALLTGPHAAFWIQQAMVLDAHRAFHGTLWSLLDAGAALEVCWLGHIRAPTIMGLPRGGRGCWQPRGDAGGAEGLVVFSHTF